MPDETLPQSSPITRKPVLSRGDSYTRREALARAAALTLGMTLGDSAEGQPPRPVPSAPQPPIRLRQVTQMGHAAPVISVSFSADSRYLATGSDDHNPRLWDVATGKLLRRFEGTDTFDGMSSISPDGRYLIATGYSSVTLYDIRTGKKIRQIGEAGLAMRSSCFSPDGRSIATSHEDGILRLWEVTTGKLIRLLQASVEENRRIGFSFVLAFSKDGRFLASGDRDDIVRVWDVAAGKLLWRLEGHESYVNSVCFSADGRFLATCCADDAAHLWEVSTGKLLQECGDFEDCSAFSPDGALLVTGNNSSLKFWDARTGKLLHEVKGDFNRANTLSFSPDARLLAIACEDMTTRLWDVRKRQEVHKLVGQANGVTVVGFSPVTETLITATGIWPPSTSSLRFWNLQDGSQQRTFNYRVTTILRMVFSPDGTKLATSSGYPFSSPHVWDIAAGKEVLEVPGNINLVYLVAFSPDQKTLVITSNGEDPATIWDMTTGKPLRTLEGEHGRISGVAYSPDGTRIAAAGFDKIVYIWDAATGEILFTLQGHTDTITAVVFSPDGTLLATLSEDGTARLWEVKTGKQGQLLQGGKFSWGDFCGNGTILAGASENIVQTGEDAVASEHIVHIWDVATGKELHRLEGHIGSILSVAISPDQQLVATASKDRTARLWDIKTGKLLAVLSGHYGIVSTVAFSRNGKVIATGSIDGTTRLWAVRTGRELCQLVSFGDGTWAVTDPEGRFDASNGGNVDGLHWVLDNEPIDLYQLKERYYTPGLLARIIKGAPLPAVPNLNQTVVRFYPQVTVVPPPKGKTVLNISLKNRGGGIGPVQVLVDGKELTADARPKGFNPDIAQATVTVDLVGLPASDKPRQIQVFAQNKEGYLQSRGATGSYIPPVAANTTLPRLFALVIGSSYPDKPGLRLRFAAKDARDFAAALSLGATGLFEDRTDITVLESEAKNPARQPTRANIAAQFARIAKAAGPLDVFVVYLAGHGVAFRPATGSDLYCFLTADAQTTSTEVLNDPAVRARTTVTSEDLVAWTTGKRGIQAGKQVLILDTCAAGKAAEKLSTPRAINAERTRAVDRMKDRTGSFVLMGCASDAVSYEATRYGQGILTYALLFGMKGAALSDDKFVDVSTLFQKTADIVPELAKNIGGIQKPEIIAPRGAVSFPIGMMDTRAKAAIPLAQERPLLLRPNFQNRATDDDELRLSAGVRDRLRGAAYGEEAVSSRGVTPVFVDSDELPGAVSIRGGYEIGADGIVTVTVRLRRDGKEIANRTITGKSTEPDRLADIIVQAILEIIIPGVGLSHPDLSGGSGEL